MVGRAGARRFVRCPSGAGDHRGGASTGCRSRGRHCCTTRTCTGGVWWAASQAGRSQTRPRTVSSARTKGIHQRARRSSVADDAAIRITPRSRPRRRVRPGPTRRPRPQACAAGGGKQKIRGSLGRREITPRGLPTSSRAPRRVMHAGGVAVPTRWPTAPVRSLQTRAIARLTMNDSTAATQFLHNDLACKPDGPSQERAVLEYRSANRVFRTGDDREAVRSSRPRLAARRGDHDTGGGGRVDPSGGPVGFGRRPRREDEHLARATEWSRSASIRREGARARGGCSLPDAWRETDASDSYRETALRMGSSPRPRSAARRRRWVTSAPRRETRATCRSSTISNERSR